MLGAANFEQDNIIELLSVMLMPTLIAPCSWKEVAAKQA